jgi:hypothetical protein
MPRAPVAFSAVTAGSVLWIVSPLTLMPTVLIVSNAGEPPRRQRGIE